MPFEVLCQSTGRLDELEGGKNNSRLHALYFSNTVSASLLSTDQAEDGNRLGRTITSHQLKLFTGNLHFGSETFCRRSFRIAPYIASDMRMHCTLDQMSLTTWT
jgi:hypothetical protein